jgi:hypothetical protein
MSPPVTMLSFSEEVCKEITELGGIVRFGVEFLDRGLKLPDRRYVISEDSSGSALKGRYLWVWEGRSFGLESGVEGSSEAGLIRDVLL